MPIFGPLLSAPLAGNPGVNPLATINAIALRPSAVVRATFGRTGTILATAPRPGAAATATFTVGNQTTISGHAARPGGVVSAQVETAGRLFGITARPIALVSAARGVAANVAASTHAPTASFAGVRGVSSAIVGTTHPPKSVLPVALGIVTSIKGTTFAAKAVVPASLGVGALIKGTAPVAHAAGLAGYGGTSVAINGLIARPTGPWSVYTSNPIPGIGATLAYLTRVATELPGVMPGPPLLKPLRGGSIEARTLDFTPDLAPVFDGLVSITGITVSRVDGALMGPNDLIITPPYYVPPWLTGTMLNPLTGASVGAAIVGWWAMVSTTIAATEPVYYKISVTVTTAGGSTLTRDCYQTVTDAFGGTH